MSPYRTVNVSKLTPGDTLSEPVFSEGLMKLLGSGCTVSEQLINRLAERGITEVLVRIPTERIEKLPRRTSLAPSNIRSESVLADASHVVEHSCKCGSVIAIQPPAADFPAAAWICKTCGAAFFGGLRSENNRGVELLNATDVSALVGEQRTTVGGESAPTNADVASSEAESELTGRDRRQQTRYSIGLPVVAIPLRANFTVAGPTVRMITRDISKSGIALSYARFSDVPYYVIDFTEARFELMQVLLKVLRVSNSGPTYELAGKFMNRLQCTDWHNNCSLKLDSKSSRE
jgi:hypothetical protein